MSKVDTSFCPASYEELFSHYYPYVCYLVQKFGIDPEIKEDVAMSILAKFFENDALSDFDPAYVSVTGAPSRFGGFLFGFVSSYTRHHRDMQQLRAWREPVSTNKEMTHRGSTEIDSTLTWIDLFGAPILEDYSELMTEDFIRTSRKHLATVEPRGRQDSFNALTFFESVVQQWDSTERINTAKLAEEFNVTGATILNWRKRLFVELKPLLALD